MTVARRRGAVVAIAATLVAVAALFGIGHRSHATTAHAASPPLAPFVAYRGPHRIGDRIGPNATVASVDAAGDPTAVVSTDGRAPMVWSFEVSSAVSPASGTPVHAPDPAVWLDPACPSVMCPALPGSAPLPTPPAAMNVDPCSAVPVASMEALLGAPAATSSPQLGTCVWNSGRHGAQIEVGGAAWWPYLERFPSLYTRSGSALVDSHDGLRVAVRSGAAVAILLTDAGQEVSRWQPIAEEVAAWAASR